MISAVASVRIDDSIDKNVQQFFQAGADTSIPGDIIERGERLDQTEMPVVGFPTERALRIRPIFVILNPLPLFGESDSIPTKVIVVGMFVDDFKQIQGLARGLSVVEGQSVFCQSFHCVRHRIQLLG